jgi:membrane-associated phospholipid phosphatase
MPKLWSEVYSWEAPIPYQQTENGDILVELNLNYELNNETVPDSVLVGVLILLPIILLAAIGVAYGPRGDAAATLCSFFVTFGLTWFLTDMTKTYTGQLRPNFYSMCKFDTNSLECDGEEHFLHESRRSFPSGHASSSFASMTIVTLYLSSKVGLARHVQSLGRKVLYLLSCTPMLLAFFVAASRVHDFYHHPADIVAGALIGSVCGLTAHGMW